MSELQTWVESLVKPCSILIAEDDPKVSARIVDSLKPHNFDVTVVSDGDVALELVTTRCFGLIFLDLSLPRRSSFIVLRSARHHCPNCPIIVLINGEEHVPSWLSTIPGVTLMKKPSHTQVKKITQALKILNIRGVLGESKIFA